jgi:pyruvate kinase
MLIEQAVRSKIPVITATQMLETMMEKPNPTRAEVSDIANAVFDGTDAVMLSGETAIGRYPVQAVRVMRRIIEETETNRKSASKNGLKPNDRSRINLSAITHAALYAARELDAKGIMVFTLSGKTAQYVSKLNPPCMVFAISRSDKTVSQLNLLKGVKPIRVEKSHNMDEMIRTADHQILSGKILKKGDAVVIVYGKRALPGTLYTITIHYVGETHPAPAT